MAKPYIVTTISDPKEAPLSSSTSGTAATSSPEKIGISSSNQDTTNATEVVPKPPADSVPTELSLDIMTWSVDDVSAWLKSKVNLPIYVDKFKNNFVDGEILKDLEEDGLTVTLGVSKIHVRKILNAIKDVLKKDQEHKRASSTFRLSISTSSSASSGYDDISNIGSASKYSVVSSDEIIKEGIVGTGHFGVVEKVKFRGSYAVAKYLNGSKTTLENIVSEAVMMEKVGIFTYTCTFL